MHIDECKNRCKQCGELCIGKFCSVACKRDYLGPKYDDYEYEYDYGKDDHEKYDIYEEEN